jgi:phenylacetate-CoA ligase
MSPERLAADRDRALRRLLSTAAELPYYTDLFEHHAVATNSSHPLAELRKLPLCRRQALEQVPVGLRVDQSLLSGQGIERHTSGSTGEPFTVRLTPAEKDLRVVPELRLLHAHGLGPFSRMFLFRRPNDPGEGSFRQTFLGFYPRVSLPITDGITERLEAIRSVRPHVLKSIPCMLTLMAEALRNGAAERIPSLRLILSSAEFLDASTRAIIEDGFGVRVADHYGLVEFGFVAWQCPAFSGFHVSAEDFLVEIVDEEGREAVPGQVGEIVITALRQRAAPLLRYRTGDLARWLPGPCSCGRTLPRFELLRARTADYLARPDGTRINPLLMSFVCDGLRGVIQFQVIQETLEHVRFAYVPAHDCVRPALEQEIVRRIREVLGESVRVSVETVDEILPEVSGKLSSFTRK